VGAGALGTGSLSSRAPLPIDERQLEGGDLRRFDLGPQRPPEGSSLSGEVEAALVRAQPRTSSRLAPPDAKFAGLHRDS
jgi:hypothetical protein